MRNSLVASKRFIVRKRYFLPPAVWPIVVHAGLIVGLAAASASAQSETQIEQGISSVLQLIIRITGSAVLGFGLVRGFTAHGTGDEEGLRTARNAVIGGLGILFTFTLVNLVVRAAGVSN